MTQTPYDRVPYGQRPHYQTHPDHLCAIARLFGLNASDPRRARVLELGCASGGNLIPMAFNLPQAQFFGIDLSERQIEDGRARLEHLGLENIELTHRSIEDLERSGETFDYVICHGVYSWVGDEVRRAIFELCRNRLAEGGVAQISFNTLPGWNMVKSVRDLMLFHTRAFEKPEEKASQARALLEWVNAAGRGSETPYSLLFKRELEILTETDDSYIFHDHLSEVNRPEYFSDFMVEARRHGLEFLADADLATMLPENLPDTAAAKLREVGDLVRTEQYLDFLIGRRFRNTLLCRSEARLGRELGIESLREHRVSTLCSLKGDLEPHHFEDGVEVSFVQGSTTVSIRGRIGKIAFSILAEEGGKAIPFDEWMDRAAERSEVARDLIEERVEDELEPIRLLFLNALEIHALPSGFQTRVDERPCASALAIYQAGRDEPVTNQKHESVRLGPAERLIVRHLNGSRTLAQVTGVVAEAVEGGDLTLSIDGEKAEASGTSLDAIEAYCRWTVKKLALHALLVEPPSGSSSDGPT